MSSAAESLWFAAPGLSHLLGNALFTVHGRARLLSTDTLPTPACTDAQPARPEAVVGVAPDAQAILAGVDRALQGLMVLRWLRGEAGAEPVDARELLAAVASVARVPLRDRGLALEQNTDGLGPEPLLVAPTPACRLILAAYRQFAEPAGPGPSSSLRSTLLAGLPDTVLVRLRLEPAPGMLPLRGDPERIGQLLAAELEDCGGSSTADREARELVLELPRLRQD